MADRSASAQPAGPNARTAQRALAARNSEELVAEWLQLRGFVIVARNLRLGHLELDIVARHLDLVVVVEVRYRSSASWTTGFGSLGSAKRRNLRRAAKLLWKQRYRHDPSVRRLRIDVAAVRIVAEHPRVEYCPAAL